MALQEPTESDGKERLPQACPVEDQPHFTAVVMPTMASAVASVPEDRSVAGERAALFQTGYRVRRRWRHHLGDRICTLDGACLGSFFCPCFQIGQISEKMRLSGFGLPGLTYRTVVLSYVLLYVAAAVLPLHTEYRSYLFGNFEMPGTFLFICLVLIRGRIRKLYEITEGCGVAEDLCLSWFCFPCTLAQVVGQVWKDPARVPGCNLTTKPVYIV